MTLSPRAAEGFERAHLSIARREEAERLGVLR